MQRFSVAVLFLFFSLSTLGQTGNITAQEYGDAVYRDLNLDLAEWGGENYNHTAIFAGKRQSDGQLRSMEAVNPFVNTTRETNFAEITNNNGEYYGSYTVSNKTLPFSDRKKIVQTAINLVNAGITYEWNDGLDYRGQNFDGSIADINNIRCDGFVEYAYESNGIEIWRNTDYPRNQWSIVNFPDHHNDAPFIWRNPNRELSPWAQRGAPGHSGINPNNTFLTQPSIIRLPTYSVSRVDKTGYANITIRATDESGIHRIHYKRPEDSVWKASPRQPQHPTGDSYSYTVRVNADGYLYYYAEDNGGNRPSFPERIYISIGSQPSTNINVFDFWHSAEPIYASNESGNTNFDSQFKIKNNGSSTVLVNDMAIAVMKDGNYLFDCWRKFSPTSIAAGDVFATDRKFCEIFNSGSYSLEARLDVGGWKTFLTLPNFTVEPSQGLQVFDFWRAHNPIYATGGEGYDNFEARFKVKNNSGSTIHIEDMRIDAYRNGEFELTCWRKNSGTNVNSGETYALDKEFCEIPRSGSYHLEAKLKVDGDWETYQTHPTFEIYPPLDIEIIDFYQKPEPIYATNGDGTMNFYSGVRIKNNTAVPAIFKWIYIEVYRGGLPIFQCYKKTTPTTLQPGEIFETGHSLCDIWDPGEYQLKFIMHLDSAVGWRTFAELPSFSVISSGTAISKPWVSTSSATNIKPVSATLNGQVNPNNSATTVFFDYGENTNFGSSVNIGNIGTGTTTVSKSANITGLDCGTTYYYRIRASNQSGSSGGYVKSFRTVNCEGMTDDIKPVYGFWNPDVTGHHMTISESGKNNLIDKFNQGIWNWQYEGIYFYALPSQINNSVPVYQLWKSGVGHHYTRSASERNTLLSNGWTEGHVAFYAYASQRPGAVPVFRYNNQSTTDHFFPRTAPGHYNSNCNHTGASLNGKNALNSTNYNHCYEGIGWYAYAAMPPLALITTNAATSVDIDSAILNASVNSKGTSTSLYFDYGVSAAYGSSVSVGDVGYGQSSLSKSKSITGLNCGTVYHFRAKAVNDGGTSYGQSRSFTTPPCSNPDISLSSFTAPLNINVEQPFTASVNVQNIGTASAQNINVHFYLSNDQTITSQDTVLASGSIATLAASQQQIISKTNLEIASVGQFWIGACAEAVTGESITHNNCSSSTAITVVDPPLPDLWLFSLSYYSEMETGLQYNIPVQIKNIGDAASVGTVARVLLEKNGSTTEVGSFNTSALQPNQTETVNIQITAPNDIGAYKLSACVDQGANNESTTVNNCYTDIDVVVVSSPTILNVSVNGEGTVTSIPVGINCPDQNLCSEIFDRNSDVTLKATPKPGYSFINWSGGCAGSGDCMLSMTTDKSVVANFSITPDRYEVDNRYTQANTIRSKQTQIHNIYPNTDVDWVKFTVHKKTRVLIETNGGSGDTILSVYNNSLQLLAEDDDGGNGLFSRIEFIDLLPGTYYAKVRPYGLDVGSSNIVPYYELTLAIEGQSSSIIPILQLLLLDE